MKNVLENNVGILEEFIPAISKCKGRNSNKGSISIVNAKTGKRITINKSILDKIGVKDKLQFAFSDDEIAISKELPNNENYFKVKMSNNKGNVYSSELVLEITELYTFDFNNKTSITFDDIKYTNINGIDVAMIKVK
ncbi:hypothetical protein [Clostridium perfringens]|uniref:hypothetical protein n=1 Tax=Clostridium perfringens TaxID=1502 RepID=UPI0018E411B4|nr:hypothetical protein [Clostridium perfringens]MBI6103260.1 hypothetical protein [Clostridium perfringens]MBS5968727.1 hypothetical protein [Clostridium perfringens]MDH2475921.1 hypothetical protein [Clostridium perfringens]MDK0957316.1 hypothetical protein [Clostridium perfringens]MDM0780280.1 hypothetical protein [Clostridium perfringens]